MVNDLKSSCLSYSILYVSLFTGLSIISVANLQNRTVIKEDSLVIFLQFINLLINDVNKYKTN